MRETIPFVELISMRNTVSTRNGWVVKDQRELMKWNCFMGHHPLLQKRFINLKKVLTWDLAIKACGGKEIGLLRVQNILVVMLMEIQLICHILGPSLATVVQRRCFLPKFWLEIVTIFLLIKRFVCLHTNHQRHMRRFAMILWMVKHVDQRFILPTQMIKHIHCTLFLSGDLELVQCVFIIQIICVLRVLFFNPMVIEELLFICEYM